jgi:hypothetical protein
MRRFKIKSDLLFFLLFCYISNFCSLINPEIELFWHSKLLVAKPDFHLRRVVRHLLSFERYKLSAVVAQRVSVCSAPYICPLFCLKIEFLEIFFLFGWLNVEVVFTYAAINFLNLFSFLILYSYGLNFGWHV